MIIFQDSFLFRDSKYFSSSLPQSMCYIWSTWFARLTWRLKVSHILVRIQIFKNDLLVTLSLSSSPLSFSFISFYFVLFPFLSFNFVLIYFLSFRFLSSCFFSVPLLFCFLSIYPHSFPFFCFPFFLLSFLLFPLLFLLYFTTLLSFLIQPVWTFLLWQISASNFLQPWCWSLSSYRECSYNEPKIIRYFC